MSDSTDTTLRTCDIVMKGGITSGVVFPKALATLSRRFHFKNIGGTSAGAIAAAAAAAAEYRRRTANDTAGFQALEQLPADLGEKTGDGTHSRLFHFFQPDAGTQRIFAVLTRVLEGPKTPARVIGSVIKSYGRAAVIGALPGIVLLAIAGLQLAGGVAGWAGFGSEVVAGIALLVGPVGAILGAAAALICDFVREVPNNNFGLCSGMPNPAAGESGSPEPLTVWLARYLDRVAGLNRPGQPLTFGDLWGHSENDPNVGARDINLEMMTTCLSHGRPYRLPFRTDEGLRENHQFYFREDEFRKLFPDDVVDWMKAHPRTQLKPTPASQAERAARSALGYLPLPDPANLPVIVATRMSLSFPFLLSAIPLYAIDRSLFQGAALPERCWFSDGGLCSNLPLHFFDSPLPRRPTFSIDLEDVPESTPEDKRSPRMPGDNNESYKPSWNRFASEIPVAPDQKARPKSNGAAIAGFIYSMIQAMQNWNDSTLGKLPGYRDRIVTVPVAAREGGMNLDMDEKAIDRLSRRGGRAAEELMKRFDPPRIPDPDQPMTWDNHRWIRLRSMLASHDRMVRQILNACEGSENNDPKYETWLKTLLDARGQIPKAPSYPLNKKRLHAALETIRLLRELRELWDKVDGAEDGAPRPRPILRPRPQI